MSVSGSCPTAVVVSFLHNPGDEPDADCIREMGGPTFALRDPDITLVTYTSEVFGIRSVVPDGWTAVAPGTHASSALGEVVIVQQAAQGAQPGQLASLLARSLGAATAPSSVATCEAGPFVWTLYRFDAKGQQIDMALAAGAGATVYVVMLVGGGTGDHRYYSEVFLPTVDALRPAGR